MYEIEYAPDPCQTPNYIYIYIEPDDDIDIDPNEENGKVTHITTIDTDVGIIPDLIIRRRKNDDGS